MKICSFILFLFTPIVIFAQVVPKQRDSNSTLSLSKFTLTFSTFNHAEWLMEGTTSYILTESKIKIVNTGFGEKKGKVIFSKKIESTNFYEKLYKLRLDTLQEFYTNWCIMTTSGDEYFLDFSTNKQKSNISLHHYYLQQLDDVITILNSLLPEKFQFRYLSKDTKQDCFP